MSFLLAETHEWVDLNKWISAERRKIEAETNIAKARKELQELRKLTPSEEAWLRQFYNEMLAR